MLGEGKPEDAIPPLERAVFLSHGSPGAIGVLARAYGRAARRSDAFRQIAPIYILVAETKVPATPVTCERICGSM